MAIDKINGGALGDNLELPGTEAAKMPIGTTAQRASAAQGDIRFNTTLSLMEYYDGTNWKAIDSPPVVSSISPTTESDANANIVITGSNFQSGATVKFVGDDGTEYNSPSVTFTSATSITATTPSTALTVANEPYDVIVTNPSGLFGTGANLLDAGGLPAFDTASGSIGNIWDADRAGGYSLSPVTATDPDGDAVTYALASGDSLPAGLSLNTSTGAITGTATAVGSDTTTTFDIEATSQGETSTREFSITVKAPVVTSYTSTGSGTFSVPSGLQTMDVLVVGGGGAGGAGAFSPGGGGAGGLIYRPAFPVTPGGSISYTVGSGGTGTSAAAQSSGGKGGNGQDSVWGTLTAKGGGGGGGYDAANTGQPVGLGGAGGSGGGGGSSPGQSAPVNLPTGQGYPYSGGTGQQPSQPGDSGTYGFGNDGGDGGHDGGDWEGGGGGGGAGGDGSPGQPGYGQTTWTTDSAGGIGKQYDISGSQVYYAGGGGGGGNTAGPAGQGGGAAGTSSPGSTGQAGTANRGGGAGGGYYVYNTNGASGGSGIIIVKY